MLKSMLIGLDGTPDAQGAMELGFRWGKRFDALLVGLGIVCTPELVQSQMVPIGGSWYKQRADDARVQRVRTQVDQFLDTFADRCLLLFGDGRWQLGRTTDVLTEAGLSELFATPMEAISWRSHRLFVADSDHAAL